LAVSARLSRKQGQKFAFTLGIALLAFAAIAWLRGHAVTAIGLSGIGAVLIAAGALVPTHLGPVERTWMQLGHALSRVSTPIVMGVVYFAVITPIGLIMRAVGKNPLPGHRSADTTWVSRERRQSDLERQF
jgi:hypothetical protein